MASRYLDCHYCNAQFTTVDKLLTHLQIECGNKLEHNPSDWHCGNCPRHYSAKRVFKRHLIDKHLPNVVTLPLGNCPSAQQFSFSPGSVNFSPLRTPVKNNLQPSISHVLSPRDARKSKTPVTLADVEKYLTEQFSAVLASFHNNPGMTEKSVQMFVEAFHSFQQDVLYIALHRVLNNFEATNRGCEHLTEFLSVFKVIMEQCFSPFRTIHLRMKHYSASGTYIPPEPIYLTSHFVQTRMGPRNKPVVAVFIPIRKVLAKLLAIPNLLDEMTDYVNSMEDPCGSVTHFMHSPNWRSMMARCDSQDGTLWLPIHLYFDEFEAGNPLGSRLGKNKLGAVYMSLPALPVRLVSKIKFIFLVMLFHAADRGILRVDTDEDIRVGNAVFRRVIDEMNYLRNVGIEVKLSPSRTVKIKFVTACLLGDNLGLNQICGFVESFSSPHCCRVCTDDYKTAPFVEDPTALRNAADYEEAVQLNDCRATGIKERCVWLGIQGFDLFANTNPDHMHDFLEGACYYVMYEVIQGLTDTGVLTISILNSRLKSFSFGPESNAPVEVHLVSDRGGGGRLRKMSANEVRVFVTYFGLLIGDLVEEWDEELGITVAGGQIVQRGSPISYKYYDLYLKLLDVQELLTSSRINVATTNALKSAVKDLLVGYSEISTRSHLPPKLHFLIHYPAAMLRNGPTISLSSMTFEKKHKELKRSLTSISSTINTPLSAAKKIQLQLNSLLTANEIPPNTFIPGHLKAVPRTVIEPLIEELGLPRNAFFKQTSTIQSPQALSYGIDSIICTGFESNDNDAVHPKFGKIINIFYRTHTDKAVALVQPFMTLSWSRHYHAYHVKLVRSLDAALWIDLSQLAFPFPNTLCAGRNGNDYILMRNSTSHFIY